MTKEDYIKKQNQYKEKLKIIEYILNAKENIHIKEDDNIKTIIYKKYIEFENVDTVAKYINSKGYRIKTSSWIGERKYIHKDITKILTTDNTDIQEELRNAVKYIINNEMVIKQFKI